MEHAAALADAVETALPGWVQRCVRARAADAGIDVDARPALAGATAEAARRARDEVGAAVRALLGEDLDAQRTTPLALLRGAVSYPTEVLRAAGVPPVARDDFARDRFPGDPYDLTPATWADVDGSLVEPGIAWGAAKALAHRRRDEAGSPMAGDAGEPSRTPPRVAVAAFTPDLMDRSKISAALREVAGPVRFVATAEALVGLAVDVVVVDLSKRGAIDVLADVVAGGARVVAYGSHVDRPLLDRARAAGCAEVLPRSTFFADPAALVTHHG